MIADLSLLALARYLPSWLHSRFHTSSVCTSRIVVVTLGNAVLSHWWSAYNENEEELVGELW